MEEISLQTVADPDGD